MTQAMLAEVVSDLVTGAGIDTPPRRRHRHHRPARDRGRVGSPHGQPRHRAIVWQDRRTAERCDELAAGRRTSRWCGRDRARARPVLLGHEDRVAPHRRRRRRRRRPRLRHHRLVAAVEPDRRRGARHRALERQPHDAVRHREPATGPTSCATCSASRRPVLPEVRPSAAASGRPRRRADRAPASRSAASPATSRPRCSARPASSPGMTKNTYGTGSFVLMNVGDDLPGAGRGPADDGGLAASRTDARSGRRPRDPLRARGRDLRHRRRGPVAARRPRHHREAAPTVGPLAASVDGHRWRGRRAGLHRSRAARGGTPTPAGTILGITRGTGRAHLARAVVESMAFQTRDVVDAMVRRRATLGDASCGSTAARPRWTCCCRLQADQLGVAVTRADVAETTALGAAYLAGLGVGVWSTAAELRIDLRRSTRVEPAADRGDADRSHAQWRRAVERARDWAEPASPDAVARRSQVEISDATRSRIVLLPAPQLEAVPRHHQRHLAAPDRRDANSSGPAVEPSRQRAEHERTEPALVRQVPNRRTSRPGSDPDRRRRPTSACSSRLGTGDEGLRTRPPRRTRRGLDGRRRAPRRPGPPAWPSRARMSSTSTPSTWRISATSRSTTVPSGRSMTSSSTARPAPRSRMSMPTTSPRTAPIRLATAPRAPGRSGSQTRRT